MKHWFGPILGLFAAALPAIAMATEEGRTLERPVDWLPVLLLTLLVLLGLALLGAIGYLYRRERGLDWDFQKPDTADHH